MIISYLSDNVNFGSFDMFKHVSICSMREVRSISCVVIENQKQIHCLCMCCVRVDGVFRTSADSVEIDECSSLKSQWSTLRGGVSRTSDPHRCCFQCPTCRSPLNVYPISIIMVI